MDKCIELKPGDILYVLFKGRARTRIYDTVTMLRTLENKLICNTKRLSGLDARRLKKLGNGSLIAGLKREKEV